MSDVVIYEDIKVSDIANHIYITRVSINDLDAIIKTIVENIVDLNWINDLPPRLHKGFKAAAAPTIKYIKDICDNIKDAQEPKTPISKDDAIRSDIHDITFQRHPEWRLGVGFLCAPLPLL